MHERTYLQDWELQIYPSLRTGADLHDAYVVAVRRKLRLQYLYVTEALADTRQGHDAGTTLWL